MITVVNANALHIPLADGCVQTVVTSPPYWSLRDYGTARWVGGDDECDHVNNGTNRGERTELPKPPASWAERAQGNPFRDICGKCGAQRVDGQLGLEPTPEEYVANMVQVFREVWRVLRDDGTLWLNLGDSYAGGSMNGGDQTKRVGGGTKQLLQLNHSVKSAAIPTGLKPKDLCGIPWRVAFALQADGWYLRSDCIWSKPNPMPESVTDRPTKAHEYLFLLSKQARYYYDADAVREPSVYPDDNRKARSKDGQKRIPHDEINGIAPGDKTYPQRNLRTVWTIATQPYSGAHFASFPEKLVEPCVKAGTSERGCCPKCGRGWVRMVKTEGGTIGEGWTDHKHDEDQGMAQTNYMRLGSQTDEDGNGYHRVDLGWKPGCDCNAGDPVPCLVLDPFAGTATVGKVCARLGRSFVGTELKLDYINLAQDRTSEVQMEMQI